MSAHSGLGTSWATYNEPDFVPIFFNADLTVMFPDEDERAAAIALCNDGQATDNDPSERRECYFDYKVA